MELESLREDWHHEVWTQPISKPYSQDTSTMSKNKQSNVWGYLEWHSYNLPLIITIIVFFCGFGPSTAPQKPLRKKFGAVKGDVQGFGAGIYFPVGLVLLHPNYQESILKVNGSRIKGWWRIHHFISTVAAGVLFCSFGQMHTHGPTSAPNSCGSMCTSVWGSIFSFVTSKGVIYRLHTLGERQNMDITIEGFHSWMWKGLSFLLPFLYIGYAFQFYKAYVLYYLSYLPDATWQVPMPSLLFFILFMGNLITTSMVIPLKLKEQTKLRYRYKRNGNNHREDKND